MDVKVFDKMLFGSVRITFYDGFIKRNIAISLLTKSRRIISFGDDLSRTSDSKKKCYFICVYVFIGYVCILL